MIPLRDYNRSPIRAARTPETDAKLEETLIEEMFKSLGVVLTEDEKRQLKNGQTVKGITPGQYEGLRQRAQRIIEENRQPNSGYLNRPPTGVRSTITSAQVYALRKEAVNRTDDDEIDKMVDEALELMGGLKLTPDEKARLKSGGAVRNITPQLYAKMRERVKATVTELVKRKERAALLDRPRSPWRPGR